MENWRQRNNQTIKRALTIIQAVPFTRMVALTGSLAEGRSTEQSDIDFFVQVEEGYLWMTRLTVTVLLLFFRIARTDKDITGKVCLNWWATYLAPAKQKGRIYKVLWQEDKQSPMKQFLEAMIATRGGKWLQEQLKNYQINRIERDQRTHQPGSQVRYSDTELGFHPPKSLD